MPLGRASARTGGETASGARPIVPSLALHKSAALPLVLTLLAASTFLPEELSFFVFGLRLTTSRLILLLLTPALIVPLGSKIAAGRYRFVLSDAIVFMTGVWMILSPHRLQSMVLFQL